MDEDAIIKAAEGNQSGPHVTIQKLDVILTMKQIEENAYIQQPAGE